VIGALHRLSKGHTASKDDRDMASQRPDITKQRTVLSELVGDLRQGRLVPSVTAGLLIGILSVINVFSFAALFFTGEIAAFLPAGTALLLIGATVGCLATALLSSDASVIAGIQDGPNAVLANLVAATLVALPLSLSAEQKFSTVVLLIVLTSLLTGLSFILIGMFKLGALVRFLPYPVACGFLAGTSWPLISGAVGLMAGGPLPQSLLQAGALRKWLPGILFALLLVGATRRYRHPLLIPALIVATTLLFYAMVWLSGTSIAALTQQGWLYSFAAAGGQWRLPLAPDVLVQVEWLALLAALPNLLPMLLIGVIVLPLNVTGIELIVQRDIDLNRELTVAGVTNLAGGLAGATVGFHALSRSGLNHKLSGGSRITSLATAAFCALSALLGPLMLTYAPKLVLGGLLAYLGFEIALDWLVAARRRFPRLEYVIVIVIALVSAAFGFLQGMVVGLVAAVLLFIINYSRINVVRHVLTGLTYQSRVTRGSRQRALLQRHGEQIQILQLQGYLFFGTANSLLEQVRARLNADLPALRLLILDFQHVTGLDSTALLSFAKMKLLAQARDFGLVFTSLSCQVRQPFDQSELLASANGVQVFADLDRGMEWCETVILSANGGTNDQILLEEQLAGWLARSEQIADLLALCERREVEAGAYLFRQGDASDDIYIVERGQVTAQLESPNQPPARLETMQGGRMIGELGFYLGAPRTAAVRADEPTIVYRLSKDQLAALEATEPAVANTLHRVAIHLLAERVTHLIRAVDALLR
jgi:SulP family sulfate permease